MDHKTTDNQLPDIKRLCGHRGLEITREYILSGVWSYNSAHKTTLKAMLADAHAGQFQVLAVWAADRLSRGGIEVLLSIVRELGERRVKVLSVPQPRLSGSDATTELLLSIAAWVANQESRRRSKRVKAATTRRREEGKHGAGPRRSAGRTGGCGPASRTSRRGNAARPPTNSARSDSASGLVDRLHTRARPKWKGERRRWSQIRCPRRPLRGAP